MSQSVKSLTEAEQEEKHMKDFDARFKKGQSAEDMKAFAQHLIAVMKTDIEQLENRIHIYEAVFNR